MNATGPDLRLKESVLDRLDYVFPGTMAVLYGVHSLHGYVSLTLVGAGQTEHGRDHNVLYESESRRQHGKTTVLHTNQVRFVWSNKQERDVKIIKETANSIRLHIEAGPAGELVRTDSYYPGWRVDSPRTLKKGRNPDGFLTLSIPGESMDLTLRYVPSYHEITKPTSIVSLLLAGVLIAVSRRSTVAAANDAVEAVQAAETLRQ
jgi:hypothetical protein